MNNVEQFSEQLFVNVHILLRKALLFQSQQDIINTTDLFPDQLTNNHDFYYKDYYIFMIWFIQNVDVQYCFVNKCSLNKNMFIQSFSGYLFENMKLDFYSHFIRNFDFLVLNKQVKKYKYVGFLYFIKILDGILTNINFMARKDFESDRFTPLTHLPIFHLHVIFESKLHVTKSCSQSRLF